jgi:hypothetical protein
MTQQNIRSKGSVISGCFCQNTLVAMVTKVVLFYIREDFIFFMFCIIISAGQRPSRLLISLGIRRLFVKFKRFSHIKTHEESV